MNLLTAGDIVEIHRIGIEEWGGDPNIKFDTLDRVDGALGAALTASMQNETGEPNPLSYAAGVLAYLARAQYFVDGNKRAAWGGCLRALEVNGYTISATTDEIVQFVLELVVEGRGVQRVADRLANWIDVLEPLAKEEPKPVSRFAAIAMEMETDDE